VRAILHLSSSSRHHRFSGGYRNAYSIGGPCIAKTAAVATNLRLIPYIYIRVIIIYIICIVVNASSGDYNIKHVYLYRRGETRIYLAAGRLSFRTVLYGIHMRRRMIYNYMCMMMKNVPFENRLNLFSVACVCVTDSLN